MNWLWLGIALAAPPDGGHGELSVGSGVISNLELSQGGNYVGGISGSEAFLLDLDSWVAYTTDVCSASAASVGDENNGSPDLLVACSDGTVEVMQLTDGSLTAIDDEIERAVSVSSPVWSWYDGDDGFVVLGTGDNGAAVSVVKVSTGGLDFRSSYPVTFRDGFSDAVLSLNGNSALIAHGSNDLAELAFATGALAQTATTQGTGSFEDITSLGGSAVLGTDGNAGNVWNGTVGAATSTLLLQNLDGPTAIAASIGLDDTDWVYIAGTTHYAYDVNNNGNPSGNPLFEGQPTTDAIDNLVAVSDGYVLGAGSGGTLHLFTANPIVSDVTISPSSVVSGVEVTLTFDLNEACSYKVYAGGTRKALGSQVGKGSVSDAATESVTFTVDDTFGEGDTPIWIIATDGSGNVGHGQATLTVDDAPDGIVLTDASLGFANRALVLRFAKLTAEDIDHYDVYVSTEPFDPNDYPDGGGPKYTGPDSISNPFDGSEVAEDDATSADDGEGTSTSTTDDEDPNQFEQRIFPLTNGQIYYVAVRAVDSGGQEGPMSNVVSETPHRAYGAAGLAGVNGGRPCSVVSGASAAPWLALVGLAGLLRRRSSLLAAGLVASLLVPSTSRAEDEEPWRKLVKKVNNKKDLTPVRGSMEIRYGNIRLSDSYIKKVYGGTDNNMLYVEGGPQFWQVLEFDVGLGYLREHDQQVDLMGEVGADASFLRNWNFYADVTLQAHILDEQFLVPFVRYGADYLIWDERLDDGIGSKSRVNGSMVGNHSGWGLQILLDNFNPGRASMMEAQTGINDSFIVVEFRRQFIDRRQLDGNVFENTGTLFSRSTKKRAFEFDGRVTTVGLKFDF